MGAGRFLKNQFRLVHLTLQHDDASDFCLSCWQRNRLALPMLCVRLALFLGCVAMLLCSLFLPERIVYIAHWLIYATNWNVIMITVASGLATAVSAVAYFKGPIVDSLGLPWYVKLDWATNIIALPIAFNTTMFYYIFLFPILPEDYMVNAVLDVFTHGINSVVMFTLLLTSRFPSYLIQGIYPVGFMLLYMLFSITYYFAGGTNQFGDRWVYPTLDWAEDPGLAVGTAFVVLAIVTLGHVVSVMLTLLRDFLSRSCQPEKNYFISD